MAENVIGKYQYLFRIGNLEWHFHRQLPIHRYSKHRIAMVSLMQPMSFAPKMWEPKFFPPIYFNFQLDLFDVTKDQYLNKCSAWTWDLNLVVESSGRQGSTWTHWISEEKSHQRPWEELEEPRNSKEIILDSGKEKLSATTRRGKLQELESSTSR